MELDLTEPVEAAARAVYEDLVAGAAEANPNANHHSWDNLPDIHKHHYRMGVLSVVVASSEALKEQIRNLLLAEMNIEMDRLGETFDNPGCNGLGVGIEIVEKLLGEQ